MSEAQPGNGAEQANGAPPSNHERRAFTRAVITQLLAQANAIEEIPRRALLNPQPIDGTKIIMGSLILIQRGLALLLDDQLASEGQSRHIRLHQTGAERDS